MQPDSEKAPKRPVNLTISSDLLKAARESGINLSAALESALRGQLRQKQRQQWLEENREAIENYNRLVDEGVFPDLGRMF